MSASDDRGADSPGQTSVIDYGDRARLGVLLPSGNSVAEAELYAMLPPGVGLNVTRLELRGSSEPELLRMIEALEPAARLLADARVDRVAFHCTAVSTFAPALGDAIRARIEDATALPAFATSDAILAAFAALDARNTLLVTPYIEPVHLREIAFLAAHGIAVAGGDWMGVDTNAEMARIPVEAIRDQALRAAKAAPRADLCFLSCTAIRSAGVIAVLEEALGIPVITSNQAMLWHGLRAMGIGDAVPGFGRLMNAR